MFAQKDDLFHGERSTEQCRTWSQMNCTLYDFLQQRFHDAVFGRMDTEFEPQFFRDGSSDSPVPWHLNACDKNPQFHLQDDTRDAGAGFSWVNPGQRRPLVNFNEKVDVVLYQDDKCMQFEVPLHVSGMWLRSFWHLNGQSSRWEAISASITNFAVSDQSESSSSRGSTGHCYRHDHEGTQGVDDKSNPPVRDNEPSWWISHFRDWHF